MLQLETQHANYSETLLTPYHVDKKQCLLVTQHN